MSRSFYASRISDNIGRTPEGYLVCRDSIIARTGKQLYRVSEITRGLDEEVLKDLGIDDLKKSESVNLFRDPEEVLDAATLASFEGKPLTDGHPSDPDGVHTDNIRDLQCGHVQNVRPMPDGLESGEKGVLADIVVTDAGLANRIESGKLRELSCGYTYDLTRDGERLLQARIRGNHVAVVPSGRAGSEVRIQDAAPPLEEEEAMNKELLTNLLKAIEQLKDRLAARRAADAEDPEKPEEKKVEAEPGNGEEEAPSNGADKKKAKDGPEEESGKKPEELKDAKRAYDTEHGETGQRLHAALDRILDEMSKEDKQQAQDTDLKELRSLIDQFFSEEEEEPEHEEGEEEEDDDDPEGNEEAEAEGEVEHTHEGDADEDEDEDEERSGFEDPEEEEVEEDADEEEVEPEFDDPDDDNGEEKAADASRWPDKKLGNKKSHAYGYKPHSRTPEDADDAKPKRSRAADQSAYKAGALDALKEIRPIIARHGSEKVRSAFQAAYDRLQSRSRVGAGSYGHFAAAAGIRSRARDAKGSAQEYYERLNKEAKEALMNPGRKKQ